MPYRTDKMVELTVLDDSVEMSLLGSMLDEKGIRYLMEPLGSTPYAGIFESQKGQARLKVFQEDATEAQGILDNFYEATALDEPENQEKDTTE